MTDRDIMEIGLANEILHSQETCYDHYLHGGMLVSQGTSCYGLREKFGHVETTIQRRFILILSS